MSIGYVTNVIEVPLDQAWSMDFRFWKGRAKGLPSTLATADVILRQRGVEDAEAIVLTVGAGNCSMQDNTAGPRVLKADMGQFAAGTWDMAVRVTDTDGGARQVRATVEFKDSV